MNPPKLRIRKKTKVPTKYQLNHKWRSDWKTVGVIEYNVSIGLFKILNGNIENDAQFASFLYKNLGPGIYSILAWKFGYSGFWSFLTLELYDDGYKRLQKSQTMEQREKWKASIQIKKLNKKILTTEPECKHQIQEEIDELKEEYDLNAEIENLLKKKRGPAPYLKTVMPIFKFHEYQSYNKDEYEEAEVDGLW